MLLERVLRWCSAEKLGGGKTKNTWTTYPRYWLINKDREWEGQNISTVSNSSLGHHDKPQGKANNIVGTNNVTWRPGFRQMPPPQYLYSRAPSFSPLHLLLTRAQMDGSHSLHQDTPAQKPSMALNFFCVKSVPLGCQGPPHRFSFHSTPQFPTLSRVTWVSSPSSNSPGQRVWYLEAEGLVGRPRSAIWPLCASRLIDKMGMIIAPTWCEDRMV